MSVKYIIKRDFSKKPFNLEKITQAIEKAMRAVDQGTTDDAQNISMIVFKELVDLDDHDSDYIPTVEKVQDIVESKLMESKFTEVAKAYILYRNKKPKSEKVIFLKSVSI